jgi:flagellar basal-body rod protein FlgF
MDNILYVGLSQQTALQRQMDVVANNLANMNTTAFKRERVLFQQYVKDGAADAPGAADDDIAFVFDYGVARNFSPGAYIQTGNSLDVALTAKGFLMVEAENGDTMYTRNGHMSITEDGTLVTSSGRPILDDAGAPITITAADRQITIAKDGTLSGKQGQIAKLGIVEFARQDEPSIEKIGESLFTSTATPQPATDAQVLQGTVEGSNVEPIKEMTTMMQISRAYQQTAKMLEQYQDIQNQSIQRLAKVQ